MRTHFESDPEGWTGIRQVEMRVWLSGWKYTGQVKRWRRMGCVQGMVRTLVSAERLFLGAVPRSAGLSGAAFSPRPFLVFPPNAILLSSRMSNQ